MHRSLSSWRRVFAVALAALALASGPVRLAAQQADASLTGNVLDQAGKSIPNAAVVVKNDAAKLTKNTTTNNEGHFEVTGLPAGAYTVDVSAPGFAVSTRTGVQASGNSQEISITLGLAAQSESVTVEGVVSLAAQLAPSGNVLDATSPKTVISAEFVKNFETPLADFGEVINYSPGTITLTPNGAGLGQGKTYFRGLADGLYNVTFDGIPFTDTNSVSHHTWSFFPTPWLGPTEFDRSPGDASTVGQSTFGGSLNLRSVDLAPSPDIRATMAYGSWDSRLLKLDFDSGLFGPGSRNNLTIDIHQMESNGYQTNNHQKRDAGSLKYHYRVSPRTTITLFTGILSIWTNTPEVTSPTRAQVAQYGNNFLLDGTPFLPNGTPDAYFFGYNNYHIPTNFSYLGINSDLDNGWRFDTKLYEYRYWLNNPYANAPVNLSSNAPNGDTKVNGYVQAGDTTSLSHDDQRGTFTVGAWYNYAYTGRYTYPMNTLTWVYTPLPTYSEEFIQQSLQVFAQYRWKVTQKLSITVGIKESHMTLSLNQFQDTSTVGCLGGTLGAAPVTGAPICVGGAPSVSHAIGWNNWLPTANARYQMARNWSVYGQFSEGVEAPPTSIYDVPNGAVTTPAKATLAKAYQLGSVIKHNRWTLDADAYYLHYQNGYASYTDITTGDPVNTLTGPSNTKGLEAESNIVIGHGFNFYVNGSMGSAKYQGGPNYPNGGQWVANAPKNIETYSLFYQHKNWDVGILHKRVGTMYNDNKTLTYLINGIKLPFPVDQAITIAPFDLTNFFFNYTIKNEGWLRGTKIGFSANNLFDNQNLVGVTPAVKPTLAVPFAPNAGDLLNLLPGRSIMISLTVGYAPKR